MRREGDLAGRKVGKKNIGWLSKQSNINGACMNILFVYDIKFSKNRSVCEFYALLLSGKSSYGSCQIVAAASERIEKVNFSAYSGEHHEIRHHPPR